ncbi:MAG: ABC transporter permease [Nitrospinota bacterium]
MSREYIGPTEAGTITETHWTPGAERLTALGRFMTRYVFPGATLVALVVLWEVFVRVWDIQRFILPTPSEIWKEMTLLPVYLLKNTWVTLKETLLGFLLSVVVGVPLAVAIAMNRFLQNTIYPLIIWFQAIPKVAIAPIFLVWMGVGIHTNVLIGFTIAFFPIVISTATGLHTAEPEMLDLVRSLSGTRFQQFRLIRFPNALPYIFTGLKVSVTLAVIGAVIGEFVGAEEGLGVLILQAGDQLRTAFSFASLFILSAIAMALFGVVALLEKLLIPWHTPEDAV